MAEATYRGVVNCLLGSPPPLGFNIAVAGGVVSSDQDFIDGGLFKVVGTTKAIGPPLAPVMRYVRLYDSISGRLIRAQWSNKTNGAYSFPLIRKGNYFVMSEDYTKTYNGVISTNIDSEPM